jgi:arylsulfatase A-like enzyme
LNPNIVIIVLDAVRAQNLPFYGYHRNTTPFLSSIEQDLAIYKNAISSTYWTMPSIASLFTGMYTSGHGLVADGDRLDTVLTPLPEVLRKQGYRCSAFVRNVYVSEYSGLNADFHDFYSKYGIDTLSNILSKISKNSIDHFRPPGITRSSDILLDDESLLREKLYNLLSRSSDVLIDRGSANFVNRFSEWLKDYKTRPFFAYMHFFETHSPYRSARRFAFKFLSLRDNLRKLFVNHDHLKLLLNKCNMTSDDFRILESAYDNSINYVDHLIGRVVGLLKRHGVYDDTLLIILADHGDNIGDHGMMFHYFCLYDSLIKIPLIVKFPVSIGLRGKISEVVQNVDLFPTILSLLGLRDNKAWEQTQGNDLLGKVPPRRERNLAISELVKVFGPDRSRYTKRLSRFNRLLLSARTKNRKFIYSSRGDHECYNLSDDPGELKNLYPDVDGFTDLRQKASKYYATMYEFYMANKQKIDGTIPADLMDQSIIDQLKSMGYM